MIFFYVRYHYTDHVTIETKIKLHFYKETTHLHGIKLIDNFFINIFFSYLFLLCILALIISKMLQQYDIYQHVN